MARWFGVGLFAWLAGAPAVHSQPPQPPQTWLRQASCIRWFESRDGAASSNLYQFIDTTWKSVGGRGSPGDASRSEQHWRAYLVWRRDGGSWREWSTSRVCGFR